MTGMIQWGQNSDPQKIPKVSNKTPKRFLDQKLFQKNPMPTPQTTRRNTRALPPGHNHESSDCFEYPNKSLLTDQATEQNTSKISLPQKFRNRNFETQKNPEKNVSVRETSLLKYTLFIWYLIHRTSTNLKINLHFPCFYRGIVCLKAPIV